MAEQKSFKARVKEEAIRCSRIYKDQFVDYDYLLCSEAFSQSNYYIIQSHEDNYRHLTGVVSEISADEFFGKCLDGTLTESDFSFSKPNQSEAQTKGAVRDKIRVLPDIGALFSPTSVVEEGFNQNSIKCVFAAEGGTFTLGFACKPNAKPMTLLRGQKLDESRSAAMELVLRRPRDSKKFDNIIVGDSDSLKKYSGKLQNLLSDELLKELQDSVEEVGLC